jgi:hypothetical protein
MPLFVSKALKNKKTEHTRKKTKVASLNPDREKKRKNSQLTNRITLKRATRASVKRRANLNTIYIVTAEKNNEIYLSITPFAPNILNNMPTSI